MSYTAVTPRKVFNWAAAGLGILVLILAVVMAFTWGFKAFGRSQATSDANNAAHIAIIKANNQVQTTNIQISTQAQQLKVHQEQAAIRQADAVGIREAQNQISGTLTPLYVQWEMTQALVQIAQSGKNSSVIYIPAGAGGVPLVSGAGSLPAVTSPAK
ncbi:hypothetical protein [Streptacidiphilus sp. PAMC 29251]